MAVILFDGVCNLCNTSVQLIIKNDRNNYFRFTSLQSEAGQKLLKQYQVPAHDTESIVLIENEKVYQRSTAALRVAKKMKGLWPMLYAFIMVPKGVRDMVYDWIARNRYKWFGRQEECMIPTPELKTKFL